MTFTKPLLLPADHYFFVPQVLASDPNVHFLWLSAPRPIVFGTPFNPDLQAWIRNADLEPDWLRVGTDIVGGGVTFNASFSLDGRLPTVYEYDFYKAGTTVAAALLSPGFLRDVSPASVPIEGFTGFIGPSPDSLNVCDLTSNSSAELDCRGPNLHSGIFELIFDRGAFPTTLGPFVGSGFLAPDATTPSIGTANLLGGQIRVLNPI